MKFVSFNRIVLFASTLLLAAFLYSCQKENNLSNSSAVSETDATTLSDESSQAEASFDDADDVAITAADEEGDAAGFGIQGRVTEQARLYFPSFDELRAKIGDCATITVTPNDSTYPKKIVIDFGDSCRGRDGKMRSGKMILYFTAPFREPGSVVTLTFEHYRVNRMHIEGTKTFRNLSEPPVHKWSIEVNDGKVTFPNGRGYTYEGIKYVKQIEGSSTRIVRDDIYQIEGHSKTTFRNGTTVVINTVDPLIKKVACPWISDGTLKIRINDRELKLDFGFPNNGDCDNKALLTWNGGNSQKIVLLP